MDIFKSNKVLPKEWGNYFILVENGDGDKQIGKYEWNIKKHRFEEIEEEYMLSCNYSINEVISWVSEYDLEKIMGSVKNV